MRILIAMEGGLISAVCTDGAPSVDGVLADVIVVDYDTDGAADDDLTDVEQADGTWTQAIVTRPMPERCTLNWDQFEGGNDATC